MYILKAYLNIGLKALCLSGFLLFLTLNGLAQTANTTAPQTFERVKVLLLKDGKTHEVAARLRFTGTDVVIEDLSGKALLTATNDEFKAAGYYYSNHRRWQPLMVSGGMAIGGLWGGAALESEPLLLVGAVGLVASAVTGVIWHTYGKRHWLVLHTAKAAVTLRLDKRHYRSVISTLENQTKLTVAWQGER